MRIGLLQVETVTSTMHVWYEQVPVHPYIWTVYVAARARSLSTAASLDMKNTHIRWQELPYLEDEKTIWKLQGNTFFLGCPANLPRIQAYERGPLLCYRFFADPEDTMPQLKHQALPPKLNAVYQETRPDHHPVRLRYPLRVTVSCRAWYRGIRICTHEAGTSRTLFHEPHI
jgi:hypothetical protein